MRMIDADALKKHVVEPSLYDINVPDVLSLVEDEPTIEAEPVKHGKWFVSEYEYLNCSVCGKAMYTGCNSTREAIVLKDHWKPFCPNCGAKMDGGEEDG